MKRFGAFAADGFFASIEFLRFLRELDIEQLDLMADIVGADPVFITGGVVTEDGGNTIVTNGILFYDRKFYAFTGGTNPGAPAVQKIMLTEATAAGYPQPYFEGDPIPKDIYLSNTAVIDNVDGTLDLTDVGRVYNLQELKEKADDAAAAIASLTATGEITLSLNPSFESPTGIKIKRSGNWYRLEGWLKYTGAGTSSDPVFANVGASFRPATGQVLVRPVSGFDFDLGGVGNLIERHLIFSELTGNLIITGPLTTDKHFDLGSMIFYKE